MTQNELNFLLDKSFTIPVEIKLDSFPNNSPYQQIANIEHINITPRELLHAIGSKTAALPANNRDECVNSAYLYTHILDFEGEHLGYKPNLNMDSDLQTNRSNEIGIGIGCLVANKLFDVNWDTLESVKGQGKRFDYRATTPGQNYVYEFKGTKYLSKQKEQIENGIIKKDAMHNRNESYDVELIVSTCFDSSNKSPKIIFADPPFEGYENEFSPEAEIIYHLRHLARISQFIGNPRLSRVYYNESKKYSTSKKIDQLQQNQYQTILPIETPLYLGDVVTINIENRNFIGRWVDYWQPKNKATRKAFELPDISEENKLEIFQGVTKELYQLMVSNDILKIKDIKRFQKARIMTENNIEFSVFSDGTVMAYRFKKR